MKIFDCFQYFDEDMMLDLRLHVLNKYVDKFVIVENLFMHSGKKKGQNFNIQNFKKFENKIKYILVNELPENLVNLDNLTGSKRTNSLIDNTLKIEHNQRNKITDGLNEANSDDLILISDVDEIPKLENIREKIKNKIICFNQKMFCYKFNLCFDKLDWIGTKATLKKNLLSPQWLRDVKHRKYPSWRIDVLFNKMKYNNIQFIEDGGWHFTNFRTPKELELKLNNFGHHAEFIESGLKLNDLEKMIEENRAVYNYGADMRKNKWSGEMKLIKSDQNYLPEYIKINNSKYKDWFC